MDHAIETIEAFCQSSGLRESSVGQMSVKDRHAVRRIREGTASLNTTQKVLDWIERRRAETGADA